MLDPNDYPKNQQNLLCIPMILFDHILQIDVDFSNMTRSTKLSCMEY